MEEKYKELWRKGFKPAYMDHSDKNLNGDYCRFCNMIWYNCLCLHDEDDD